MGLIHIYYGDGKGKTTCALGLAIRASGSGMRVHIVQMLKGNATSELNSLKLLPNVSVKRPYKNFGFTQNMSELDKEEITDCHNKLLNDALAKMQNKECDMLIIDEFFDAYNYNLVDKSLAEKIVLENNNKCELVLTGRNPPKKFTDIADYISEIKKEKHPYDKGVTARKGIEY